MLFFELLMFLVSIPCSVVIGLVLFPESTRIRGKTDKWLQDVKKRKIKDNLMGNICRAICFHGATVGLISIHFIFVIYLNEALSYLLWNLNIYMYLVNKNQIKFLDQTQMLFSIEEITKESFSIEKYVAPVMYPLAYMMNVDTLQCQKLSFLF